MPESHINWVFLPICQGSGLKLITNRQGSPWPLNAFLLTLLLVAWQLNSSILYLCTCCQDHTFPKASGLHKANGRISLPLWWSGSAAEWWGEAHSLLWMAHILECYLFQPTAWRAATCGAASVSSQKWCLLFAPDSVLPWKWDCLVLHPCQCVSE